VDPVFVQAGAFAVRQTAMLAANLLSTGMMKGRDPKDVDLVVQTLSSRQQYPSHGSVIDADEATRLGLRVQKLSPGGTVLSATIPWTSASALEAPTPSPKAANARQIRVCRDWSTGKFMADQ